MTNLPNEQLSIMSDKPQGENLDIGGTSESANSHLDESYPESKTNIKKHRGRKSRWLYYSLGILLFVFAAAGHFVILRPYMATVVAIHAAMDSEIDFDITVNDLNGQVWSSFINNWNNKDAAYNIEIAIPDYGQFEAEKLNGMIQDPVYDISKQEVDYVTELQPAIREKVYKQTQTNSSQQSSQNISIHVLNVAGEKHATCDSIELAEIYNTQEIELAQLTSTYFKQLPLSVQCEIYKQRTELIQKAFGKNEYLVNGMEVENIETNGDNIFSLRLKVPSPAWITIYYPSHSLNTIEVKLKIRVSEENGNFVMDQLSCQQSISTIHDYYVAIGAQLEKAGEFRAASLAYTELLK